MTDIPSTFDELKLPEDFKSVIDTLGFTTPTPIQAQALPHSLAGRDVIGKAETGTGKTLAFGLPLLKGVDAERKSIQGLVLCPTRELAFQVLENLEPFANKRDIQVGLAIGGEQATGQFKQLAGCQVLVGTPGRVIELNRDFHLSYGWVDVLVLDEFDRMLDMGFLDDVTRIINMTLPERQTLLFSATFPPAMKKITQRFMKSPTTIEVSKGVRTAKTITQEAMRVTRKSKFRHLRELLDDFDDDDTCIVFCNSKKDVRFLDRELWGRGYNAASLSSDHDQDVRFQILEAFKKKEFRIIVATDVASRGLDIPHVSCVINYTIPMDVEDYVHRIGRTGRAGRTGRVISLVAEDDFRYFQKLTRMLGEGEIEGAEQVLADVPTRSHGRSHGRKDRPGINRKNQRPKDDSDGSKKKKRRRRRKKPPSD